MNECLIALLGGLAGSAHCVGMCGGLVVSLGVRGREREAARRQLVYALGRVFTYSVGGLAAGSLGLRLQSAHDWWPHAQPLLQLVGGLGLLVVGLELLGWSPWHSRATGDCLGPSLFSGLQRSARGVFLAGLINGFLPCGLVYAWLALAFATGNPLRGAAVMACFGVGTVPALAALGIGASWLSCGTRRKLATLGAWVVLAAAVIQFSMGVHGLMTQPAPCPYCSEAAIGNQSRVIGC